MPVPVASIMAGSVPAAEGDPGSSVINRMFSVGLALHAVLHAPVGVGHSGRTRLAAAVDELDQAIRDLQIMALVTARPAGTSADQSGRTVDTVVQDGASRAAPAEQARARAQLAARRAAEIAEMVATGRYGVPAAGRDASRGTASARTAVAIDWLGVARRQYHGSLLRSAAAHERAARNYEQAARLGRGDSGEQQAKAAWHRAAARQDGAAAVALATESTHTPRDPGHQR